LGQPLLQAQIAIPGYEILGELGSGGMGVVYKARHLQLKRLAALKVILGGAHASADQLARFRREAAAAARLQHPNIVHIYEIGEYGTLPYFAQEYMDGGSLGKRLRAALLPPREAAQLVATLAQAMQTAHEAGIIHRDLKPDNVLLNSSGICKITDFGLAKQLDDDSVKTRTDAIIGTPSYMAPEQAAGKSREIGPLSDVYALGAILYECLTGRPPFKAANSLDTLVQVRTEEPVRPRHLQPRVPRDLETICLKCLQKDPRRRYASAEILARDLQRFLNGQPIQARRVRFWERAAKWMRRRPAAAALVGILLALGLALPIAGWQYYAELGRRWQFEQKGLDNAQREVDKLHGRVMTMKLNDLEGVEAQLKDYGAEPQLESLRKEIQPVQAEVAARMVALRVFQKFLENLENALIHGYQAAGDDFENYRKIAGDSAMKALIGLPTNEQGDLALTSSFTEEEKTEITTGCYFLLLILAEIEVRALPHNATWEQEQEALKKSLNLLKRAEKLKLSTRAIHLCRARYLKRLGDVRQATGEEESAERIPSETVHDHFLVGYERYSQNDLAQAIQEFSQALMIDGGHFWSHYFLGICYLTLSEPNYASKHLTICHKQQRMLPSVYLLRGFALGQMKDYVGAERDFKQAFDLERTLSIRYMLYNNRGVMRVLQAAILPISATSTAALLGSPGGQSPLLAASTFLAGRLKHEQGLDDLNEATTLFPDRHEAWQSLAVAHQLDSRLVEALNKLGKAIDVAIIQVRKGDVKPEKLAQLLYSRAWLYLQRSSQEAPVGDPSQVLQLAYDNQSQRAESLSQREDRQTAIQDLEEASRLATDSASLRARADALRGRILHLQGHFEKARTAFENALAANPGRGDVHRWRGELLLAEAAREAENDKSFLLQGKNSEVVLALYREAVAALGTFLNKGGAPSAAVYRQRGQALAKLDQHRDAIYEFTRALEAKPTEKEKARLHLYRGQEYLTIPASQYAFDDFNEALLLGPENPDAYLGRAYAQVRLGDPYQAADKAVRDAEQAVKARPKDPRLRLGAARVYALAVANLQSELGKAARQTAIRVYQERAEALLRTAFSLVPADQQSAWLGHVRKDKALDPIGSRFLARFERATP
jgi:tetratricopeptide (TPR) repeat protein